MSDMQGGQLTPPNANEKLEEKLDKMNESLQTVIAEIQSLNKRVQEGEAKNAPDKTKAIELRRYYHDFFKDHLYTTGEVKGNGWVFEGVVGRLFPSPVKGTVPLFHFLKVSSRAQGPFSTVHSEDHHYTTDLNELEKDSLGNLGYYCLEGICCYMFPSPLEGTKPLFRYYNKENDDHLFTTNWAEFGGKKDGYTAEGIAGYLY